MKFSTHPVCGCTDPETGKQLGSKCPKLYRPNGTWNPRHGTMGWAARIPATGGTRLVRRYGYPSGKTAGQAAEHAGRLLDLAPDEITRAKIGDLIIEAKRGAPLPAVEDVRRRLGLGLDPGTPGVTVAQWMDGWLAGKRRTRRASTVRSYEMHNRLYISPVIGDLPVERISAAHVEAVLAAVPGSAATRHRVLATLRAALSAAVKQRQITFNPCTGIELEPEQPPEARRWTPAEARRFIRATADDPMGLLFRIAILTGERRGELCGLRWASVDLANGVLTIDRTLLQLGGKLTEGTPKTKAGVRRV
jgi:hypothetical protein